MWHCNKCEWYYLSECPACPVCPPKSSVSAREQFGVLQNDPLSEYWLSSNALDPVHCNCLVVRQQAPQWTVHWNIQCPTALLYHWSNVKCPMQYCTVCPTLIQSFDLSLVFVALPSLTDPLSGGHSIRLQKAWTRNYDDEEEEEYCDTNMSQKYRIIKFERIWFKIQSLRVKVFKELEEWGT